VNAKRFNERDSAIWIDAKVLHVCENVSPSPMWTELTYREETREDNVRKDDWD
jgi:hypothetical protein